MDQSTIQLSPIFFGVLLTLFILSAYCLVRILFNRSHHKGDNVIENSKQSTSLLCGGGGSASGSESGVNSNGNNGSRTDTLTKVRCTVFQCTLSDIASIFHSFKCHFNSI